MAGRRRSAEWYGGDDRNAYIHRAWMRRGLPADAFDGRPHIAIANTASDLNPCNAHLDEVAEHVKRGVWEAGGVPLDLPAMSLGETQVRPTAMLWRNLAAMATEEMLRANPIDGVVLLGGCDKTIPSLLMAAASVDLPAIVVPGGPMLTGTFRGVPLGCGTDVWRLSEEVRAGTLSEDEFLASESSMIRSRGHCNTMGTASTMGCVAEALGMTIPGIAGTPAPDSRLLEHAHEAGRLVVEMVDADRRPSVVLTRGLVPERDRRGRRDRRIDQRRRPPAGPRRPARDRPHARRLRRRRQPASRSSSISSRRAGTSWRTSIGPAACSPSCARSRTCSTPTR